MDINVFLTKDRMGFAAGDLQLYRYAGNGFTNGSDPSGNWLFVQNEQLPSVNKKLSKFAGDYIVVNFGGHSGIFVVAEAMGRIRAEYDKQGQGADQSFYHGLAFPYSESFMVERDGSVNWIDASTQDQQWMSAYRKKEKDEFDKQPRPASIRPSTPQEAADSEWRESNGKTLTRDNAYAVVSSVIKPPVRMVGAGIDAGRKIYDPSLKADYNPDMRDYDHGLINGEELTKRLALDGFSTVLTVGPPVAKALMPARTTAAIGLRANKAAGDAMRDVIAAREAPALTEQSFSTVGGVRVVDVLKLGDEMTAIESKVGRTFLDSRTRQELARDWWLVRQKQVGKVAWEFSRSDVTGKVGPSKELLEKLYKLGFDVKVNP